MSLVSGFPHHPVMHHHDSHYSFHAAAAAAAAAGRCGHDDVGPGGVGGGGGAGPYFTGWLISHADVSPTEYGLAAAGYSPEYHQNSGGGGGGSSAMDPHSHHHHHHHYGPGGGGGGAIGGVPGSHHGGGLSVNVNGMHPHNHPHHHPGRPVKRRPTANRKERRRTQSINSAFAELRECIPNVPADTKLSKIKTLRLATSYISYLMDILDKDGQHGDTEAFKADFKKTSDPGGKEERRKREAVEVLKTTAPVVGGDNKKTKGRTGWPQHVWALELKQ